MEDNKKRKSVVRTYLSIVRTKLKLPTQTDLKEYGITVKTLKDTFGSFEKLVHYVNETHSDKISKYILSETHIFTTRHLEQLSEDIKKYKRFVVTTVVSDKKVFTPFFKSLKSYCDKNNAKLLLIPCADVSSRSRDVDNWIFDPILKNETFIFKEIALNKNIFISSIKLSAKQIQPTTGLSRIGQRNGSYIFASPKQFLEFVINGANEHHLPHAIMTPGALTIPDYGGDRYMSERVSYIAENDHVCGAIIVEIENDKKFHFRQVQSDKNGTFVDLGIKYDKRGNSKKIPADIILGDYHAGKGDKKVLAATEEICQKLMVKDIYLHDFFDGDSINHHEADYPLLLAAKEEQGGLTLRKELELGGSHLNKLATWVTGKIMMVKGNHDEWLLRYLKEGAYVEDPPNHYISLEFAMKVIEGVDPLKYAYLKYGGIDNKVKNRIIWLDRNSEIKVAGIELAAHGDLGLNGAAASLLSLEKAYGECVVGHLHSGAILRGVFRVGTCTGKMSYQVGPTSHTNTHCLIYPTHGSRQLINIFDGKWCI